MGKGTLEDPFTIYLEGIPLSVIADPDHPDTPQDPAWTGQFEAQDSGRPLSHRDVADVRKRFTRGSGYIVRQDEADDDGHGWAENGITWLAGGLQLTGKRTAKGSGVGLSSAATDGLAVLDTVRFNGHRYCMTSGGCLIRFPNDDPTQTPVFDPALNTLAGSTVTTSFRSGYTCKSIFLFNIPANAGTGLYDIAGVKTKCLFVVTYNSSLLKTRVYQYNTTTAAPGWTESAAMDKRLDVALKYAVWWETASTGAGAKRILAGQGSTIYQCLEGSNPLDETHWVSPISLDPDADVQKLLAFPQYALGVTSNGLWTFNDIRSMNLTPSAGIGSSYSVRTPAALYNNGVAWARGSGLSFYDASVPFRNAMSLLEVGPMACMQDGTPIRGVISADPVEYEGYLLMPLYNAENKYSYLGRAIPRDHVGIQSANPWVHYWAEHAIAPTATTGQQIVHLAVSSPTVSGSSFVQARTVNVWMFTADDPAGGFSATSKFNLYYAPLPVGSGPLSYQVSSGTFSYLTSPDQARFYLTELDWHDPLATKYPRIFETDSQLQSQTLSLYTRTNGNPTTITDQSTWDLFDSTTTDSDVLTSLNEISTHRLGLQVVMQTASASVGPVFRGLSARGALKRQQFKTLQFWAIMDRDYELKNYAPDPRDPDDLFSQIILLQDQGRKTYTDETGTDYIVYVEQGESFRRIPSGDYDYTSLLLVTLTLVRAA